MEICHELELLVKTNRDLIFQVKERKHAPVYLVGGFVKNFFLSKIRDYYGSG